MLDLILTIILLVCDISKLSSQHSLCLSLLSTRLVRIQICINAHKSQGLTKSECIVLDYTATAEDKRDGNINHKGF